MIRTISLILVLFLTGCSFWNEPTQQEIEALQARLASKDVDNVVRTLYETRQFRPIWIARGKKLEHIEEFFRVMEEDPSHGVHTDVSHLRQEHPSDLIEFDIDVTSALVEKAAKVARKEANVTEILNDAIEHDRISLVMEMLAPKHLEYERLRHALQGASPEVLAKIELNMDRWRDFPDDFGDRHIRVNIPTFELEVHDGGQIPVRMKVVVGSNDNKTPIFSSEMKHVVFSPYWNIPESIMTEETLPKILEDPDYFAKQNLEVVRVSGNRGEVIDPEEVDWDTVGKSGIQLRQRPGAGNSLGLVKFLFPNKYNVYLHDTPADKLFGRDMRNLSHGCVRLEQPAELAKYVLKDQADWTPERIERAMHAGRETHVALTEPLPVHLIYLTAWVDDDGQLHLEDDIYDYDAH